MHTSLHTTLPSMGRITLALGIGLLATSCGGDSPSEPTLDDITGTWELTQVTTQANIQGGGAGLPVTFTAANGSLTFHSGELTLNADQSYVLAIPTTAFGGTNVTLDDGGTFTLSGRNLTFSSTHNFPRLFTARVNGNEMMADDANLGGIDFDLEFERE